MVVKRCSTTLKLKAEFSRKSKKSKSFEEVNNNSWFEGGRSIFLKGKIESEKDVERVRWYMFMIPAQCLCIHQKTQNYRNKINKLSVDIMMHNHSLCHTFPVNFELPYRRVDLFFTDLFDAPWVVLDSTIYVFGASNRIGSGIKDEIYYLERNAAGTIFPAHLHFEEAGRMTRERRAHKVVALDGKIYVFGDNKDVFCEVFEPYPDRFQGQSRPISSPVPSSSTDEIQFVVAIEKERKIFLGFNHETLDEQPATNTDVFLYDVVGDSWVKHNNTDFFFNLRSPHCHPVAVGSCLYWLDTKMHAYDLSTKQCFEGSIEDCSIQRVLETAKVDNLKVTLLHLGGEFFCMTWVDCHDSAIIHCTTIQALKTTTNIQDNRFKLHATVFSCQSFSSDFSPYLQDCALIL